MRSVIAMVLIVGLGGCSKRATLASGGITASTGLVMSVMGSTQCASEDIGCAGTVTIGQTVGPPLLIGGLIVLLVGAAMKEERPALPVFTSPPPPAPYPARAAPALPAPAPIVAVPAVALQHQLAIQISELARTGDCTRALALGRQLFQLDPDLHRTLAAIDAPYAGCIASAR